jgi:hypothetical protein
MIRINLLENAPKGKEQAAVAADRRCPSMEVGDMGSPKLKVLVGAGNLAGSSTGLLVPAGPSKSIADQDEVAEQKNRELADVKARYLERQPRRTTTSGAST